MVTCRGRLFAALALAAGIGMGAASAEPKSGGTLTVALAKGGAAGTEFTTKHDHATGVVLHHIFESLVSYRDDLTIGGDLAEAIAVSDDLKTYTFTLRPGVTFHNGATLTAADVKWAMDRERQADRDWGSHCREWLDGQAEAYHRPVTIDAIAAPDDRTVVITLESRSNMLLPLLANEHCMFPVYHRDSVNADGSWKTPIGTGPYRLKAWKEGQSVELVRFEGYAPRSDARNGFTGAKIAYFDTLRFVPVPDNEAAKKALVDGTIDAWFEAPTGLLADLSAAGLSVHASPTAGWQTFIVQTRTVPLLRDVRMRRAISYATDTAALTAAVFGTHARPNPSAVAVTSPYYSPRQAQGLGFDPDKARALLAEAGYAGEEIRILTSLEPYPDFHTAAVALSAQLQAAGINAVVELDSWENVMARYQSNDYQLLSLGYSPRLDPALMYSAIAGRRTDHGWYVWEDGEAEALSAYSTIVPEGERQALFDLLHARMIEAVPIIGVYAVPSINVLRADIKGFEGGPVGYARYWGVWRE